jgi:hypothetical protein
MRKLAGEPRHLTEVEYKVVQRLSKSKEPIVTISPSMVRLLLRWYKFNTMLTKAVEEVNAIVGKFTFSNEQRNNF